MKYIKIHWIHNFDNEPEYIYSEIDNQGYETRKIEIYKNGYYIIYSESINSDRLTEGKYPSLEELTFKDKFETMQALEIRKEEFYKIWKKYNQ